MVQGFSRYHIKEIGSRTDPRLSLTLKKPSKTGQVDLNKDIFSSINSNIFAYCNTKARPLQLWGILGEDGFIKQNFLC